MGTPTTDAIGSDPVTLSHPDGDVLVSELGDGRREVRVAPGAAIEPGAHRRATVTAYPLELIALILEVKGPAYLCDEIPREEDRAYIGAALERDLLAYVRADALAGATVLDFGCGSGASTLNLARILPRAARIVAMDPDREFLRVARARQEHYGEGRITFVEQPDPAHLPPDTPQADLVVLNAVVEHMLVEERRALLPQLWQRLPIGGRVFVAETPHRWFPIEAHTTGLWLLNYQSDRAAWRRTRRHGATTLVAWEEMLRAGIRGSTEREIVRCLTRGRPEDARLLLPSGPGIARRADLWHRGLSSGRRRTLKRAVRTLLDVGERVTGSLLTQNLVFCLERVR